MGPDVQRPRLALVFGTSLLVGVLVFLFHLPFATNEPLFDDAADYMRASQANIVSTWVDTNSASLAALISMRKDPGFHSHPWDTLYANGDNAALRHFHGPVSFYIMHVVDGLSTSELAQRRVLSGATSLTCAAIVLILALFSLPLPLAALLGLLAGVQSRYIETSTFPTPHAWYMLFALCFLFFLTRFFENRKDKHLYLAAGSFALAFATLEFSASLFFTIPLSICLIAFSRNQQLPSLSFGISALAKAVGFFFLITFLLWPGGWLRGGYLESYGTLGAQVIFKNHAFDAAATRGGIYQTLFSHHAILLLLTILSCVGAIILLIRRRFSMPTIVFASYAFIAFVLGKADHFRLDLYVSEFLLFFIAAWGLIFTDLLEDLPAIPWRRYIFVPALCLIVAVGCLTEWQLRHVTGEHRPWLRALTDGVRENVPTGETLLVTNEREALSLYLSEYQFDPTATKTSSQPRIPERDMHVRYYLFDSSVQPAVPSQLLATYPTDPGHAEVLWKANDLP
jgi:hypothetical protein